PEGSTEVLPLDLANLKSVQGFADEFTRRHDRLDVLLNNAGVTFIPHERTVDGFERQFGTNHLGHFALTGRLFGRLASTPGARVVTVTSPAERGGTMDFDDLMYDRGGYATMRAYGRSKLATCCSPTNCIAGSRRRTWTRSRSPRIRAWRQRTWVAGWKRNGTDGSFRLSTA
ncbi:MAG: SDR family NAD(P)-dependent oxidoreductase, partial [Acidobacteria bacterium]|nr:SDR family NAD(P)-dependent oxidoreductase [Acidobacteriota bacterium]